MVSVLTSNSEIPQKFLSVMSNSKDFNFVIIPRYKFDDDSKNIIQKQEDVDEAISLAMKVKSFTTCIAKSTTADGISFFII